MPRQLAPILRQGALFVPSAQVHVLRPSDGSSVGTQTNCDLVPDCLRVDERGWFYVAEESGHLRAYGLAPHFRISYATSIERLEDACTRIRRACEALS